MTHFFIAGTIKAQGPMADGRKDGRWAFNNKAGYLWQVGHFATAGRGTGRRRRGPSSVRGVHRPWTVLHTTIFWVTVIANCVAAAWSMYEAPLTLL